MSSPEPSIVSALAAARKAVQLYPATHSRRVGALDELEAAVRAHCDSGAQALNLFQGRLYLGSDMVSTDEPGATALTEALESRGVESLTFEPGFSAADAEELVRVLALRPSPALDVEKELVDRGVTHVKVTFLVDEAAPERAARRQRKTEDVELYRNLLAALDALRRTILDENRLELDKVDAVAQTVIARLLDDRSAALGLATLRSQGEQELAHGVNVMIYAVALGSAIDLAEGELSSLGVSALLHDIGKTKSGEVRGSAAETAAERDREHPLRGAQILERVVVDDPAPMLVAWEHHMGFDGGGWPERPADHTLHPYSRMVAVANAYENLIKGVPGRAPMGPEEAVAVLLEQAGKGFDPVHARLLVRVVGVFPIGCLVQLTDDSVGVVADTGSSLLAPKVRLAFDPVGRLFDDPPDVDLSGDERSIAAVLDPELLRVDVAEYL